MSDENATQAGDDTELVVKGGGGTLWDDLDGLEEANEKEYESEVNDEAEKAVAIQEKAEEIKAEKEAQANLLKLLAGENEYEVPEDAIVNVKINGEEQQVSLNDLRQNYSGKTVWDAKFSELGKEKDKWKADIAKIDQNLKKVAELAEGGDPLGALELIAIQAGKDPEQVAKHLIDQARKVNERFNEGGEKEFNEYLEKKREERKLEKMQKEAEATKAKEAQLNLQQYILSQSQSNNIPMEKVGEAFQILNEKGQFTENMTSEQMVDMSVNMVIEAYNYHDVMQLVDANAPQLSGDDAFVEYLLDVYSKNPDFTQDDFVDIIEERLAIDSPNQEDSDNGAADDEEDQEDSEEVEEVEVAPKAKAKKKSKTKSKRASSAKKKTVDDFLVDADDGNEFFD